LKAFCWLIIILFTRIKNWLRRLDIKIGVQVFENWEKIPWNWIFFLNEQFTLCAIDFVHHYVIQSCRMYFSFMIAIASVEYANQQTTCFRSEYQWKRTCLYSSNVNDLSDSRYWLSNMKHRNENLDTDVKNCHTQCFYNKFFIFLSIQFFVSSNLPNQKCAKFI